MSLIDEEISEADVQFNISSAMHHQSLYFTSQIGKISASLLLLKHKKMEQSSWCDE